MYPVLTPVSMHYFHDELRKLAAAPHILPAAASKALMSAGALGGVGAGVGAGLGALAGGVRGYRAARQEGAGVLDSVRAGGGQALQGGLLGAGVGAGVGGLAGAVGSRMSPDKMEAIRSKLTERSGLARFGQRQIHGLTGATNADGLKGLGMDSEHRKATLDQLKGSAPTANRWEQFRGKTPEQVAARHRDDISRASEGLAAARRAEAMGLTSLPGIARSAVNAPLDTARAALDHQLKGTDAGTQGLTLGLSGLGVGMAARSQEGDQQGDRLKRVGRAALHSGAGILTGGLPILPNMLASSMLTGNS